jgi:two-component system, OmpR family, sensor histidine kinase BaeS
MHRHTSHYIPRPPWWPEEESWPPQRGYHNQRMHSMQKRFRQRTGCGFMILVAAIFFIITVMVNGIMHENLPNNILSMMRSAPMFLRVITWGLSISVISGLVYVGRAMRKAAIPLEDMLEAAGKIAEGDFSARVPENGPGEMVALSHAFNEMSARLQLNEQQRRALLADISHELRTPLTVIQGNLEGMLDGIYPTDEHTLQAVLDETHTLARIIEDLRTLTIVESGSLKLQLETVDPREFLEEFMPVYCALAKTKNVSLSVFIEPNLPDLELDPTRIREVLANLINNALRYCHPGGSIYLRCEKSADNSLRFTLQDDGAGISPQDLPHIFERFFKDRDSSGSGLGLPIAKSLVEVHGGKINAESEEGKGTTIRFTLPLHPA